MKNNNIFIILVITSSLLFPISFVSSSFPLYVKPLDSNNQLMPSTYQIYEINFTSDIACTDVILSQRENVSIGTDGSGFIGVDTTSLSYPNPSPKYLCEYFNNSFRKVHNLSDMLFQNIYLDRITSIGNLSINNSNLFVDVNNGNVGIGTDSPAKEFHLRKTSGTVTARIEAGDSSATFISFLNSGNHWTIGQDSGEDIIIRDVTNGNINIVEIENGAPKHSLLIKSTGNIGIGTSSPSEKLSIESGNILLNDSNKVLFGTGSDASIYYDGSHLFINPKELGSGGTSFVGKIGINRNVSDIDAANTYLEVNGNIEAISNNAELILKDSNNDGQKIRLLNINGLSKLIYYGGDLSFSDDGSSTSSFIIKDSSGNVGIGTDSPSEKLSIESGNILLNDSNKVLFGTGSDASITYNGSHMLVNPQEVGSGNFIIQNGNVGIGTDSPSGLLHLKKTGSEDLILDFGVDGGILWEEKDNAQWRLRKDALGSGESDALVLTAGLINPIIQSWMPSGNIGIGTTTPSQKLDVRGIGNFSGTVYINNGTDISEFVSGGGNSSAWNRSGSNVILANTGDNVGIGTVSPSRFLDVMDDSGNPQLRLSYDGSNYGELEVNSAGNWLFTNTGSVVLFSGVDLRIDNNLGYQSKTAGGLARDVLIADAQDDVNIGEDDFDDIVFRVGTLGESVRIKETTGNVGIGTASPSEKLSIESGNILLNDSNKVLFGTGSDASITYNGSHMLVNPQEVGSGNFIIQNGNVGIGTDSPEGLMHIQTADSGASPGSASDDFVIEGTASTGMTILGLDDSTTSVTFGSPSDNIGARFQWKYGDNEFTVGTFKNTAETVISSGNNVEAIRIDGSQNVGIGTASPTHKLNVVGDTNITGNIYLNNSVGLTGNYTNGNCWNYYEQGILKVTNCTAL